MRGVAEAAMHGKKRFKSRLDEMPVCREGCGHLKLTHQHEAAVIREGISVVGMLSKVGLE